MTYVCPNGHDSTAADFCDTCGAKMDATQSGASSAPEASAAEWAEFLMLLRKNPGLDPARGPHAPLVTRLTGATLDPLSAGGARVRLLQYRDGASEEVLAESVITPRRRT